MVTSNHEHIPQDFTSPEDPVIDPKTGRVIKWELDRLIIGTMHVVIYRHVSEEDEATEYSASFEPDPGVCNYSCYAYDVLDDLALAAQAVELLIRCYERRLGLLQTCERLNRLGVIQD